MGKMQTIRSFMEGVLMIVLGVVMLFLPAETGFQLAAVILSVSLLIRGALMLGYYATMARHMVGGKLLLYMGFVVLDFGMFTMTLTDVPHLYLVLYLVATHAFGGVISILHGLESKKQDSPSWKLNTSMGAVNLILAILCIVCMGITWVLVYLYCAGLIYSGCVRIITTFRKKEIVYIQ